ncbi:hypothetical protein DFJ73DRAFT_932666 [Zopfochytrium polystomum]|nr:hypothetical protein DFJ73DRAFT_932666 [Zopfochytrium polystomum]
MAVQFRTETTDLLGCTAPIICAPMAGVSSPELAAAVARRGGFPFLAAGYMTDPLLLRQDIERFKQLAPEAPFGVGFITWTLEKHPQMLDEVEHVPVPSSQPTDLPSPRPRPPSGSHLATPVRTSPAPARTPPTPSSSPKSIPSPPRSTPPTVWSVDAVVAQGRGAGGHGAQAAASIDTLALVPLVADAVGDRCAVVAAGAIADGRGLAAALMLGASAAALGTAFAAAVEARGDDAGKRRLVAAARRDAAGHGGPATTVRTRVFDGLRRIAWPEGYDMRVLANAVTADEAKTAEEEGAGAKAVVVTRWQARFDAEAEKAAANARVREERARAQAAEADRGTRARAPPPPAEASRPNFDVLHVCAGEAVGLVRGVFRAEAIMDRIMEQAEDALRLGCAVVDRRAARL